MGLVTQKLIDGAQSVATGDPVGVTQGEKAFQVVITGGGSPTATVVIESSADRLNWLPMGTVTLPDAGALTDGFSAFAPWPWLRARITATTGTPVITVYLILGH